MSRPNRLLVPFLLSLGVLSLGVWVVPDSLTRGATYALFSAPLLSTPAILALEYLGFDLWNVLVYENMVTVYGIAYVGAALALYARWSPTAVRAVQAFLLANLVAFVGIEFTSLVQLDWARIGLYTVLMGVGLALTTERAAEGSLAGSIPPRLKPSGTERMHDDDRPPDSDSTQSASGVSGAASARAGPGVTSEKRGADRTAEPALRDDARQEDLGTGPAAGADEGTRGSEPTADESVDRTVEPSGRAEASAGKARNTRREAGGVPSEIPRGPTITVDYGALTDEEPIGGGGNADVTRAILPTPSGDVTLAIKRPRMSGTLHADAVERMLNEAETWDKLDDHDHVVGVVDYGGEPIPWIAMEYMDAGHLGNRVGGMGTRQALWTAVAVTRGVRHAHRRGVAHLDLKPTNVLFRSVDGAWDVPKVADWGLSKHLLDHSKSVEGMSVEYAAPEQFDEAYGQVDDITDVYQLGAVFYELFTGRPPFEGKPFTVMEQVKTADPTPPSQIADVPDGVDRILLKALEKSKADRYESVLLLRNDFQEVLETV